MTYKETKKKTIGEKIHPKKKSVNVTITGIQRISVTHIQFLCDDEETYHHKDVNQPILRIIENGKVTYSCDSKKHKFAQKG